MGNLLSEMSGQKHLNVPVNLSEVISRRMRKRQQSAEDVRTDLAAYLVRAAKRQFGDQYEFQSAISENGDVALLQILRIVSHVTDPNREVSFENARRHHPDCQLNGYILNPVQNTTLETRFGPVDFKRITVKNPTLRALY